MGQRKRKKGEEKRRAKFAIGKIEPLCATAPTSPRTHMFCPPSLRVATLISIPCPPVLLLPRVFFFLLLAASVCNFDPMYLRVSSFHGSCKKGGVDTCALCGLKNESQYVHDKIYIYIYVCMQKCRTPSTVCTSLHPFSPSRFEREERERRGEEGIMAIPMRRPRCAFEAVRCGLFQRRDLQYRWGLRCTRYNVLLLLLHARDLSTR